jgi:hypothetical protein
MKRSCPACSRALWQRISNRSFRWIAQDDLWPCTVEPKQVVRSLAPINRQYATRRSPKRALAHHGTRRFLLRKRPGRLNFTICQVSAAS